MTCSLDEIVDEVAYQLRDLEKNKTYRHWDKDAVRRYVTNGIRAAASYANTSASSPKKIKITGPGCVFDLVDDCQNVMKILDSGNCSTPINLTERQKRQLKFTKGCRSTMPEPIAGIGVDIGSPTTIVLDRDLAPGEELEITVLCENTNDIDVDNLDSDMCGKYRAAIVQHALSEAWDMHSDDADGRAQSQHHFSKWTQYLNLDARKDQQVQNEQDE